VRRKREAKKRKPSKFREMKKNPVLGETLSVCFKIFNSDGFNPMGVRSVT